MVNCREGLASWGTPWSDWARTETEASRLQIEMTIAIARRVTTKPLVVLKKRNARAFAERDFKIHLAPAATAADAAHFAPQEFPEV
jgi:hypothetical protein